MEKINLYIPIEIKVRELEGRTLLALEAAGRGFRSVIGKKSHINEGILSGLLPPGIYFDKSLTRGKEEKIGRIASKKCIIISQDEEGGFLSPSYERFLSFRSTPEAVRLSTAIFCWGLHDYLSWKKLYPHSLHKFHVTGSPRVDFWRHEFSPYFKNSLEIINSKYGNYVLIPSNFVGVNSFMTFKERSQQMIDNGLIRGVKDQIIFKRKIEEQINLFNSFLELIPYLVSKHPDLNFIVRPHPAENMTEWEKRLPKHDNMHIIFEGGISSWVRGATAIIHNGCMTGVEAYVSNIPAIAYSPFKFQVTNEIPNQLSINYTKKNDVSVALSELKNGCHINENRTNENDELIRNRVANYDGDTAANNILNIIEEINMQKTPAMKSNVAQWIIDKKSIVSKLLKMANKSNKKSMQKFPGLKHREIIKIQKNLVSIKKNYGKHKIQHLFGDVFVID